MAQIYIKRRELEQGKLPFLCMKCGCKADEWKSHSFRWQSGNQRLASMFGNVSYYTVTTCEVPICSAHRNHWWTPMIYFGIGFAICAVAVVGGGLFATVGSAAVGPAGGLIMVPAIGLFFVGFLFAAVTTIIASLRTVRITNGSDDGLTFAGLHDDFVSALEKARRGGKGGGKGGGKSGSGSSSGSRRKPAPIDDDDDDDELEVTAASQPAGRGVQSRPGDRPAPPPRKKPHGRQDDDDDDDDAPPPKRKSPVGMILLAVGGTLLLGLVVVCGVGGYLIYTAVPVGVGGGIIGNLVNPPRTVAEALAVLDNPDSIMRIEALRLLAEQPVEANLQPQVMAAVEAELKTASPFTRTDAARVLGKWATNADAPMLLRLANDSERDISQAGLAGLVRIKDPRALPLLAAKLPDHSSRDAAAKALGDYGPTAEGEVIKYYFHPDGGASNEARKLCQRWNTKDEVILKQAIADLRQRDRRDTVVRWLENAQVDDTLRSQVAVAVEPVLYDGNVFIREPAAHVLVRFATKDNVALLVKAMTHESGEVRKIVLEPLIAFKDPRAAEGLAKGLESPFDGARAVEQLRQFGPSARDAVLKYLNQTNHGANKRALEVLAAYMTPESALIDQCVKDLEGPDNARYRPAVEWLLTAKVDEERRSAVSAALNNVLLREKDIFYVDNLFNTVDRWLSAENIDALKTLAAEVGPFTDKRRARAIQSLGRIKDARAVDALWLIMLTVTEQKEAVAAGNAIINIGDLAVPKMTEQADKDKQANATARVSAWSVLGFIAPKDKVKELQVLAAKDPLTMAASKAALTKIMAR